MPDSPSGAASPSADAPRLSKSRRPSSYYTISPPKTLLSKRQSKVCCISAREADALTLGNVPDCHSHLHMSAREAREWLNAEYGPERLIPTKLFPEGIRQRRYQGQLVRQGRKCYLIIEFASSPQTGMSGGIVCVQWKPGLPPEKPKRDKQISNGYPQHATWDATKADFDKTLAPHRCQEL